MDGIGVFSRRGICIVCSTVLTCFHIDMFGMVIPRRENMPTPLTVQELSWKKNKTKVLYSSTQYYPRQTFICVRYKRTLTMKYRSVHIRSILRRWQWTVSLVGRLFDYKAWSVNFRVWGFPLWYTTYLLIAFKYICQSLGRNCRHSEWKLGVIIRDISKVLTFVTTSINVQDIGFKLLSE